MNNHKSNKRPASPPPAQPPPQKQHTTAAIVEDSAKAMASRFDKWKRPALSQPYLSHSTNILFQQLEVDYVIGDTHQELLPDCSGPRAIIRIFGVTREGEDERS